MTEMWAMLQTNKMSQSGVHTKLSVPNLIPVCRLPEPRVTHSVCHMFAAYHPRVPITLLPPLASDLGI